MNKQHAISGVAVIIAALGVSSIVHPASSGASLEQRVQRLEDTEAIRSLLIQYGRALDKRDFDGVIRFKTGELDWRPFVAALVPPHLPHAFEGSAQHTVQIFIEPETLEGRALLARFGSAGISELPADEVGLQAGGLREAGVRGATGDCLERAARDFVEGLAGAHRPALVDQRSVRDLG
jgi:hypothetical protein